MNIAGIRKQLSTEVFGHDILESILANEVSNVNAKIAYMVKKGELVRLKKGLYALGEDYRMAPVDMIGLANTLYAPSYVSFDYMLSYYGLIPERVHEVTSATMRMKKEFNTRLGRFTYKPIALQAYALGIDWLYDDTNGGRLIATPEKALCDKIRSDRGIGRLSQRSLKDYLESDLRIDMDMLYDLDPELILAIAAAYKSSNLKNLGKVVSRRRQSA